jgi:hypothetical protein
MFGRRRARGKVEPVEGHLGTGGCRYHEATDQWRCRRPSVGETSFRTIWTPVTYGEPVEREVFPKDVPGRWGLNEFLNYLEENIGTRPAKRGEKAISPPTFFFHGSDPITKPTIIHRQFIDLFCVSDRSFQRCLLSQDFFESHGVWRPSSDARPRRRLWR